VVGDGLLVVALAVLGSVLVGVGVITVLRKQVQAISDGRTARAEARVRPQLIRIAGGEPAEELARGHDEARTVDRLALELLGKVRGEARSELVALLTARGLVERARRRLRRPGRTGRARAAELLGVVGGPAVGEELARVLAGDRDRAVRLVAARALGRLGDPTAVAPLLAGLADGLPAGTVAHAVLQIGPRAVPGLETELATGSLAGRTVAAELLGRLGAVTAAPALGDVLLADPDAGVRARAATALGRIGVPGSVDPLLAAVSRGGGVVERAAAAEALGRMSAIRAVPALAGLVAAPEVPVAGAAAGALAGLGPAGRRRLEEISRGDGSAAAHARQALGVAA
jgi:HEAT repeat protein